MLNKDYIESMQDLCDYFYAEEPTRLNPNIYMGTKCGAQCSLHLEKPGIDSWGHPEEHHVVYSGEHEEWAALDVNTPLHSFVIHTIVEGSDAELVSEPFVLPVKKQDVADWMDEMEAEASWLWEEANPDEEEL